jgi:predicted DsbA family dithiol-disulfide isomerase
MNAHVEEQAKEAGLAFELDKVIPVNTMDAHRMMHLSALHGLQGKLGDRIFQAYFTKGENISDLETLVGMGLDAGLDADEVRTMLAGNEYLDDVKEDIEMARQMGIKGVPYFVFNFDYALSGAQPVEVFESVLQQCLK